MIGAAGLVERVGVAVPRNGGVSLRPPIPIIAVAVPLFRSMACKSFQTAVSKNSWATVPVSEVLLCRN